MHQFKSDRAPLPECKTIEEVKAAVEKIALETHETRTFQTQIYNKFKDRLLPRLREVLGDASVLDRFDKGGSRGGYRGRGGNRGNDRGGRGGFRREEDKSDTGSVGGYSEHVKDHNPIEGGHRGRGRGHYGQSDSADVGGNANNFRFDKDRAKPKNE